jgi:4-amino-4-deoxy-L-arabinose transferase-like glycosyltransferase
VTTPKAVSHKEKKRQSQTANKTAGRGPVKVVLVALAVVIVVMHLWNLGQTPAGAYSDELSIGYNALSILNTGMDEHGVRFPLFFEAFGEYKNPVFIYALVPLLKIFGPHVWVLRLTAALFGLGAALLIALIVREASDSAWALFAFSLAAALPWLFTPSRISFEVISYPCLIALAWWSWLRAEKSTSAPLSWYLVSSLAWGISLFAYTTARLLTPALVVALILCYWKRPKLSTSQMFLAFIPFAACIAALVAWGLSNPGKLTVRFDTISIWKDQPTFLTAVFRFASNYLDYLSPSFLFVRGDPTLRHHTGQTGELFLFMFPAMVAGVCYAWQHRREPLFRFCLVAFSIFPLAASLTLDKYNSLRTINAIPFVIVLAIKGFQQLRGLFSAQRIVVSLLMVLAVFEAGRFYYDYFVFYPGRAHAWFSAGLPEAIQTALANKQSNLYYSPLIFTDEGNFLNPADIYFQFFGQLDPGICRKSGISGFGIYALDGQRRPESGSIILFREAAEFFTANETAVLFNNVNTVPPNSVLVDTIKPPGIDAAFGVAADRAAFRIYKVR